MASDAVPDCAGDAVALRVDEGGSPVKQSLKDVEDKLVKLSERISLCNRVVRDLQDLNDVLVRKSLQDVSLPMQK